MIEVKQLTKKYGTHIAVDNISFEVHEGEILGFLGPNGAGKSTTMNILTGYLSATNGQVSINGHDILDEPNAAKANIGYLPEQPPLYPDMTVRITNSGIGGHTSRDLLERFDRDVISLKPDWVSICIGINDVWRQFDSPAIVSRHVYPDEYERNVEAMIEKVKGNVKGIFILSPYIIEPLREDMMRKKMDEYVEICRRLAKKHGKKVIAFCGCTTEDAEVCNQHGIDAFFPILRTVTTLDEALDLNNAYSNLRATAYQVFRLL